MNELRLVLVLLLVGSCLQSHDDNRVAIRTDDCVKCHQVDYDATTVPPHDMVPTASGTVTFPTTCADCHRTTSWQPALGGLHPAPPKFPVTSGPHDAIKCLKCHDLDLAPTSVLGANTNCVQCHPKTDALEDAHVGTRSPTGTTYAYAPAVANFCLTCHPNGLAKKHPRDQFPLTGPHNARCTSCHDRASGLPDMDGMNTTCINGGCHSLGEEDGHHNEEDRTAYQAKRGDGSNRHFCLASGCHPNGLKND